MFGWWIIKGRQRGRNEKVREGVKNDDVDGV